MFQLFLAIQWKPKGSKTTVNPADFQRMDKNLPQKKVSHEGEQIMNKTEIINALSIIIVSVCLKKKSGDRPQTSEVNWPQWAPGSLHSSSTCKRVWVSLWPCIPTPESHLWASAHPGASQLAGGRLKQPTAEVMTTQNNFNLDYYLLHVLQSGLTFLEPWTVGNNAT